MIYDSKIIEIKQKDNDVFQLTWLINNFCNNKCSYCEPDLHSGKRKTFNSENVRRFLKILLDKHPKIHCNISGGEPTLSPHFLDVIKILNENNCSVGVNTNGVRKIDYWEKIAPMLDYIVFSYHVESKHNEDFFKKIEICKKYTSVLVRVMMPSERWSECLEIYKKISKIEDINFEPVRILDRKKYEKEYIFYTDEQNIFFENNKAVKNINRNLKNLKKIINYPNSDFYFDDGRILNSSSLSPIDLINNKMTNFYGYSCSIGLKSLFIHHNGDIYLGNCAINGVIGNLNNIENIKWPIKKIICNKKVCHCSTDIYIDKKKIIENNFIRIIK